MYELHLGDCLEIMGQLEANSIDTCITDPPYGLKFMGKEWDHGVPGIPFWTQVYRLLKPGAFLLAFGGTRTFHRLTCAIEDSGFEIRDCIMWLYGSGWPKGHDIGRATGMEEWEGWGTTLKPAWEPITVAMKPKEGTFAQNALEYGVSGLNIDGGRVPTAGKDKAKHLAEWNRNQSMSAEKGSVSIGDRFYAIDLSPYAKDGRWPANLIFDEKASKMLDESVGETKSGYMKAGTKRSNTAGYTGPMPEQTNKETYEDSGKASRFFYCVKASKSEKNEGLKDIVNKHPTVKPLSLMRYLCKLTRTPTGGTVLDPFMGSGSTGIACILEDRGFIGIDNDPESFEVAEQRIKYHSEKPIVRGLFD